MLSSIHCKLCLKLAGRPVIQAVIQTLMVVIDPEVLEDFTARFSLGGEELVIRTRLLLKAAILDKIASMKQDDDFSCYYRQMLQGRYDCVDRIVLNGYFPRGHSAGGFRSWWRELTGSDDTLDQEHLLRMAGRFSRRVPAYAKANKIPLIHCAGAERKHQRMLIITTFTSSTESGATSPLR